jgi:hypothetical protein
MLRTQYEPAVKRFRNRGIEMLVGGLFTSGSPGTPWGAPDSRLCRLRFGFRGNSGFQNDPALPRTALSRISPQQSIFPSPTIDILLVYLDNQSILINCFMVNKYRTAEYDRNRDSAELAVEDQLSQLASTALFGMQILHLLSDSGQRINQVLFP